jgi:PAS domain S-box-containing protein
MSGSSDQDASPRTDAEQLLRHALRRAEEERNRSEAIIAAIGDGISIQNTEFKVIYQNQKHRTLVGDHVGEYCYQAYEHQDEACEGCPVALSFRDGGIHTVVRSATTPNGTIHVEITSSPLRDASGKIIAGIEVARDITARKRMEQEKEKLLEDLRTLVDTVSRSQKEWRDTFDHIQDPIFITDASYTIIKANQAFAE